MTKIWSADEVYELVRSLHDGEEDDDLSDRIWRSSEYEEADVPARSIDCPYNVSSHKVDKYLKVWGTEFFNNRYPRIVIDAESNVVDGCHRLEALKQVFLSDDFLVKVLRPVDSGRRSSSMKDDLDSRINSLSFNTFHRYVTDYLETYNEARDKFFEGPTIADMSDEDLFQVHDIIHDDVMKWLSSGNIEKEYPFSVEEKVKSIMDRFVEDFDA